MKLKLPPKPKVDFAPDGTGTYTDYQEWEEWGRACAEAALEKAAQECNQIAKRSERDLHGAVRSAAAIRNIDIEEE